MVSKYVVLCAALVMGSFVSQATACGGNTAENWAKDEGAPKTYVSVSAQHNVPVNPAQEAQENEHPVDPQQNSVSVNLPKLYPDSVLFIH